MFIGTARENGLLKNLISQLMQLQHIRALLQALKSGRASMTQMQELYIVKEVDHNLVDVTKDAKKQPGIIIDAPTSVRTRIKIGIGSFKVACYVNRALVRERKGPQVGKPLIKPAEKQHDEIRFTFEEIGIIYPGKYDITFVCISTAEKVYERRDMKNIRIYVSGVATILQPTQPAPQTGTITLYATVNGKGTTEELNLTLEIQGLNIPSLKRPILIRRRIPAAINMLYFGDYRVRYIAGAPAGTRLENINPPDARDIKVSGEQTLTSGGEIPFTFNFVSVTPTPTPQLTIKITKPDANSSTSAGGHIYL